MQKRRRTHTNTLTQGHFEGRRAQENKDDFKKKQKKGIKGGGENPSGGSPQLFGVVLLDLRPLFHKLHILLHQLQAGLRVLLNDVILVLGKRSMTDK